MQLLVFVSDVCITEMAVLLILLLQRWSGVRPTLMTIINSSKRICFFIGDIERRCPCKMAVTISSACAIFNKPCSFSHVWNQRITEC